MRLTGVGVGVGVGLAGFADLTGFVGLGDWISFASYSINLPPPPGPPGTYFRFLKGGGSSLPSESVLGVSLGGLPGCRFLLADNGAILQHTEIGSRWKIQRPLPAEKSRWP